jgi:hypothetical protein
LRDWYPDEYDMLRFLAQGDQRMFTEFARDHALYTRHLIGYGLITQSDHGFGFNIEALREYVNQLHKYERLNLTDDEKVAEISARRNRLEKLLRVAIRNTLHSSYGKKKAAETVLAAIPEKRREALVSLSLDALLARDSSPLFLLELISLIKREWQTLQNVFEMEKSKLEVILDEVNSSGRPDAHAKYVQDDEFVQLRLYFKKLENVLEDWTR